MGHGVSAPTAHDIDAYQSAHRRLRLARPLYSQALWKREAQAARWHFDEVHACALALDLLLELDLSCCWKEKESIWPLKENPSKINYVDNALTPNSQEHVGNA